MNGIYIQEDLISRSHNHLGISKIVLYFQGNLYSNEFEFDIYRPRSGRVGGFSSDPSIFELRRLKIVYMVGFGCRNTFEEGKGVRSVSRPKISEFF